VQAPRPGPDRLLYLQPLYLAASHADAFPRPPGCPARAAPRAALARRLAGAGARLGADAPVLAALNKYYKFSPALLDAYARVLRARPTAVLLLVRYRHYKQGIAALRREAAARGVAPVRLLALPEVQRPPPSRALEGSRRL
jgi:predicted O-linked N-acetylglucosamine transferase (SPINDLY family)